MNFTDSMKTTWKLITVILAGLAYLQPMAHSQSALEASRKIKERADAALNQYRNSLSSTAEDPTKLHELAASAEKCKGELQSLESEIDSQLDFLSKKEAGISSSGLAEVDRKELLSALASQKKPLSNLRTSNLAWKKIFEDFTSTTAKEWQDIYSSFSDIAGPEKAKAKLAERIKSYESKLPWPGDSGSSLKAEKDQPQSKSQSATPASNKKSNTSDSGGNVSEAIDPAKMNTAALRSAAKSGNPAAECELGMRYKIGAELQRDSDQAIYWLTRAAEKGNVEAQLTLGLMYRNGEGVGMNYQVAKKWLSKAAASGSQYAKSLLREM